MIPAPLEWSVTVSSRYFWQPVYNGLYYCPMVFLCVAAVVSYNVLYNVLMMCVCFVVSSEVYV